MTAPAPRRAEPAPDVVGGRFEIDAELGRGGMAIVFAAKDKSTGQRAAVKLLTGRPDAEQRERFAREVRAAGGLNHPGICRILAVGDERGAPFIAMELVDGPTLAALAQKAALPSSLAAEVLRQLLDALAAAHDAGVVHRDLKPTNVMVGKDGAVKLLDFGIAKAEGDQTVTATGALVGTPAFMSPEQARSRGTDARSDLFSLGLTVAALLNKGRHRFTGLGLEPTQLLLRVAVEPTSPLADDVPETAVGLDAVLAGLCAIDPADRFPTARAALTALLSTGLCDGLGEGDGRELLRRFVKAPPAVAAEERKRLATLELLTARKLESVPGGAPAAALAAHRAALLDPERKDATALRDRLAQANKFRFDESALADKKLAALDEALRDAPDNPALLVQRARLLAELGDVRREAATLWRAARIKHDPALIERARTLLAGPERPDTHTVRALFGPQHGGAARKDGIARAHLATRHMQVPNANPADVVLASSRGVGEPNWMVRGIIAAMLLFAAAFLISTVRGLVKHQPPPPAEPTSTARVQEEIQRLLRSAEGALGNGDPVKAVQLSSELLEKEVSIETGREALWIRARARARLGMNEQARIDLDEMTKRSTAAEDPRAAEIAKLKAQLQGVRGVPGGLQ